MENIVPTSITYVVSPTLYNGGIWVPPHSSVHITFFIESVKEEPLFLFQIFSPNSKTSESRTFTVL